YWSYGALLCTFTFVTIIFGNLTTHLMTNLGQRLRATTILAIYERVLELPASALNSGEVLKLVTSDASQWLDCLPSFHQIWAVPLTVFGAGIFLFQLLGSVVASIGLFFMCLMCLVNVFVSRMGNEARKQRMAASERRILACNELLSGIRIVKFFCWEESYLQKVQELRKEELDAGSRELMLFSLKTILLAAVPGLVSIFFLLAPVWFNTVSGSGSSSSSTRSTSMMSTATAFLVTNICYKISLPILHMANVTGSIFSLLNSLARMQEFLSRGGNNTEKEQMLKTEHQQELAFIAERDRDASRRTAFVGLQQTSSSITDQQDNHNQNVVEQGAVLSLHNVAVGWREGDEPILQNVDLRLQRGETVVIMGRVGGGKSTLIKAILGEAKILDGRISPPRPPPKVSYVSQSPFLFAGTVRENILFYRDLDEHKYAQCISMSHIEADILYQFPHGDQTLVGERGGNLSGGQRMRLALYDFDDTELFLFDDVFAALDNRTAVDICTKLAYNQKPHQAYLFTANKDFWTVPTSSSAVGTNNEVDHSTTGTSSADENKDMNNGTTSSAEDNQDRPAVTPSTTVSGNSGGIVKKFRVDTAARQLLPYVAPVEGDQHHPGSLMTPQSPIMAALRFSLLERLHLQWRKAIITEVVVVQVVLHISLVEAIGKNSWTNNNMVRPLLGITAQVEVGWKNCEKRSIIRATYSLATMSWTTTNCV
ncbi:unnamed protein product, partial [Amoebophrya sp. A25]